MLHTRVNAFSLDKIAEISQRDLVTGLPQRRFFTDAVDREIIRAQRNERAFAICKVDVDNMKSIIDDYGKAAFTQILSDTSTVLRGFAGDNGNLCRYNNQSFAFIQPVDTESDIEVIRKMLETLLHRQLPDGDACPPYAQFRIRTTLYSPRNPCTGNDLIKKIV